MDRYYCTAFDLELLLLFDSDTFPRKIAEAELRWKSNRGTSTKFIFAFW